MNLTKRHGIDIKLSKKINMNRLREIMCDDEISEYIIIPQNQRILLFEDIDAMGDAVLRREWKKPEAPKKVELDQYGEIKDEEHNPIDLSFLLNLLDGTLESEGRILAITTNFPDRIDRALIRPGRIDMIINFKKCSLDIVREMTNSFYDTSFTEEFDSVLDYKWSPAEINQILFRNIKNPELAIKEMTTFTTNDLYGFDITRESFSKDEQ
jgi:SpoVK/Ycf46/Vps4 family AAA+-type ATPase